jgi:hypothetical protein
MGLEIPLSKWVRRKFSENIFGRIMQGFPDLWRNVCAETKSPAWQDKTEEIYAACTVAPDGLELLEHVRLANQRKADF